MARRCSVTAWPKPTRSRPGSRGCAPAWTRPRPGTARRPRTASSSAWRPFSTACKPSCPAAHDARAAGDRPVVLGGHSRAGPLLAAAGTIITQVRGYVFVDARLPTPGQAWLDTAPPELAARLREMTGPDGWL